MSRVVEIGTQENTKIIANDVAPQHEYLISSADNKVICKVPFQDGPTQENGVNGVYIEDCIVMAIDRLEQLNVGEYRHNCNGQALKHLYKSLGWLKTRTEERRAKGILGTKTP